MASIKCGNCKATHDSVPAVQACYQGKNKPTQTLDDVLGADVNPDPKVLLDKWQADQQKINEEFTATVDAFTAEKPITEKIVVPAHRAAKAAVITAPVKAAESIGFVQLLGKAKEAQEQLKKGQELECGMYQTVMENGAVIVYKIKFNKAGTLKFAEKLIISQKEVWDKETQDWKVVPKGKFWYAPGMMNKLTSENKMTEEQAKAFHDMTKQKYGQDYGFCCVCGKLLTVKKSIAAGIGPVCGSKF